MRQLPAPLDELLARLVADDEDGGLKPAIRYLQRHHRALDPTIAIAFETGPEERVVIFVENYAAGSIATLIEKYRAFADYLDQGYWHLRLLVCGDNGLVLAQFDIWAVTAALRAADYGKPWWAQIATRPEMLA